MNVNSARNVTAIKVPYNTISFIFKTERYSDNTTPNNMLIGTCIHMRKRIQFNPETSL